MFVAKDTTAPVGTAAAILGNAALNRRLTVYAGAGLSAAPPTSLPGASTLAHKLAALLASVVDLTDIDTWDLLAVADKVELLPSGLRLLHDALTRVADFATARPNYAHQVLALLICEGAVTALEANYDDCIERAAQPERIPVAVDDSDRLDMDKASLLKVHGCITRPSTMLVTSAELNNPPLYAKTELAARLSSGEVAFIGLGSPADYVKSSVKEFTDKVPATVLTLVDPKLDDWAASGWVGLIPGLTEDRRVAMGAEEFCDELLRFYVQELRRRVAEAVATLDAHHAQRSGAELMLRELESRNAVWLLRWLRSTAWRFEVGRAVVTSSRVLQGFLALAMLTSGKSITSRAMGIVSVTAPNVTVMLVVADHAPIGSAMAVEAEKRISDARAEGRIDAGATVVAICCGHSGPLGPDEVVVARGGSVDSAIRPSIGSAIAYELIPSDDEPNIIDAIGAGSFSLVSGDPVIDIS